MDSVLPLSSDISLSEEVVTQNNGVYSTRSWTTIKEPIGVWSPSNFTVEGILEHLNVTKDLSDYLWHFTRYGVVLLPVFVVMHISICLPI